MRNIDYISELCKSCGHTRDWHQTGSVIKVASGKGKSCPCKKKYCKCLGFTLNKGD